MPSITVKVRQTPFDIAIQESGDVEAVVKLATDNGMSVTDRLFIGQIMATDYDSSNAVVATLVRENRQPATDFDENSNGIGVWVVQATFKVQ